MCYYQVFVCYNETTMGFQDGMVVENAPTNAGDAALIPGSIRTPVEGNGNPPSILAWKIPWAEESGGLLFTRSQKVRHDLVTQPPPHSGIK